MEKGIIKMVIIVTLISMLLLIGSICIAMRYGGMMMKSMITSDQRNQDSGARISDFSSLTNYKNMKEQK